MICRSCGAEEADEAFTCSKCGADVAEVTISGVTQMPKEGAWHLPVLVLGLGGVFLGALAALAFLWRAGPDQRTLDALATETGAGQARAEAEAVTRPEETWLEGVEGLTRALQDRAANEAPLLILFCAQDDGSCAQGEALLAAPELKPLLERLYKVRLNPGGPKDEAALAREYKAGPVPGFSFVATERAEAVALQAQDAAALAAALMDSMKASAAALVLRGSQELEDRKLNDALSSFDAAIALTPRDAVALQWRGLTRSARGELDLAAADFKAAVSSDPALLSAREHLAYTYLQMGLSREAREAADALLAKAPDYGAGRAQHLRGLARGRLGDTEGALADLARACELGVQDACQAN